ncbi:MAG: NAD(P)-dependent oxidoreductase [Syntrophobacteraceae bacterium]
MEIDMQMVLVSHNMEDKYREVVTQVMADEAQFVFLQDVPESRRCEIIEGAGIILSWNPAKEFTADEFGRMMRLRLVQLITAGAEHLPFPSLPKQAQIASNPGAFADAMAEHILGMLLALAKRLCPNNAKLSKGEFNQATRNRIVRGLACGVLGFGGIGKAAAEILRTVGLRILAVNTSGRTTEPVDFTGTLDDLEYVPEKQRCAPGLITPCSPHQGSDREPRTGPHETGCHSLKRGSRLHHR